MNEEVQLRHGSNRFVVLVLCTNSVRVELWLDLSKKKKILLEASKFRLTSELLRLNA